jgi:hypothetical protein
MAERLSIEERMQHDYDAAKKRGDGGGGQFVTPEVGDNIYRILPPWQADEPFYRRVPLHFGLAASNEKLGFQCPKVSGSEPTCPSCEMAEELYKKGENKAARDFQARDNYYSNVLVVSTPSNENEDETRVWRYSSSVFRQVMEIVMGRKYNLLDPKIGHSLLIKRTGLGRMDTEYNLLPEPDILPLKPQILKQIPNLNDDEGVIESWTSDQLRELMEGADIEQVREGSVSSKKSVKPVAKTSAVSGRGRKPEPEPEPEEEEKSGPTLTTAQVKEVKKLLKLYGSDIPDDDADCLAALIEATTNLNVKKLGKAAESLESLGADISGKLVSWPDPTETDVELPESDEDQEIKRLIAEAKSAHSGGSEKKSRR